MSCRGQRCVPCAVAVPGVGGHGVSGPRAPFVCPWECGGSRGAAGAPPALPLQVGLGSGVTVPRLPGRDPECRSNLLLWPPWGWPWLPKPVAGAFFNVAALGFLPAGVFFSL